MFTIKDIPVFEAVFSSEMQGMLCISLVDCPATEVDFQAFADNTKLVKYSVIDDDKHIVRGLIMAANMPIYRRDEKFGEYYIVHSPEFLRNMAERYFNAGRQNNMDTNHNFQLEEGCDMVQFYIKDTANGIAPAGYDDIADGSLFGEFHITNDSLWAKIKAGEYKGFSIAALYDLKPIDNKTDKANNKMSKITRFVTNLMKFGEIELADGKKLFWDGENDLKEGDAVYVEDAEGNKIPAADGEYEFDGKIITVVEGAVISIVEKEIEEVVEVVEEMEEVEPAVEPAAEPDDKDAKIVELEGVIADKDARIAELEGVIADKDAKIAELEARIAELEKEDGENVEEEFERHMVEHTGNSKLDRAVKIASYVKK